MSQLRGKEHVMMAAFAKPGDLLRAARKVIALGGTILETFSPVPIEDARRFTNVRKTRMPVFVLFTAALAGILSLSGLWWISAVDYPWNVSGKPFWSLSSDLVIAFEVIILFGGAAAFGYFMWTMLRASLFRKQRIPVPSDASNDQFYLCISADGHAAQWERIQSAVHKCRSVRLEQISRINLAQCSRSFKLDFLMLCLGTIVAGWLAGMMFNQTFRGFPQMRLLSDMVSQSCYTSQEQNPFFDDQRASREPPAGTLAVGQMRTHILEYGLSDGIWVKDLPADIKLDGRKYRRGKQLFETRCAPCHGLDGKGGGLVDQRLKSASTQWRTATSLADGQVVLQPAGQLYHAIAFGAKSMPGHGSTLTNSDRWALVTYIEVLQYLENKKWTHLRKTSRDLLSMAVVTLIALLVSFIFDRKKTFQGVKIACQKLFQISPVIFEMIALISIVLVFIPDRLIAAYLGAGGAGILVAAVLGSVVMMPGFIVFPLCGILLKKGVSYMVLSGFASTSMMVGALTFPLERKFLGTKVALLRNLVAFVISLVVALATGLFYGESL